MLTFPMAPPRLSPGTHGDIGLRRCCKTLANRSEQGKRDRW